MVAKKSLLLNELYFKANINEQFLLIDDNEELILSTQNVKNTFAKVISIAGRSYIMCISNKVIIKINNIKIKSRVFWLLEKDDQIEINLGDIFFYNIIKTIKKMPYPDPIVKTYPKFTSIVGILGAFACDRVWIYNNYLLLWIFRNIQNIEYWADFKFGNELKMEEFCKQLKRRIIYRKNVRDLNIIEFIDRVIGSRGYIAMSIDLYYIKERFFQEEERIHLKHEVLISGIDKMNEYVILSDFMKGGKYCTVHVDFDSFIKAYNDVGKDNRQLYKDYGDEIVIWKFNSYCENIDLKRVYDFCLDAYKGTDIHYNSYLWIEHSSDELAYGLNFYDVIHKNIVSQLQDTQLTFDVRLCHLLVEYGRIMSYRIGYLLEEKIIELNDKVIKIELILQQYNRYSRITQSMALKIFFGDRVALLKKIDRNISILKTLNKNFLELLLDVLEFLV